ncbi:transcription initiation factor TFIID subunit 8-like [Ruditapes philippinarum]|uniref:transcription initiation factor TFIID subunit 8-like n=1 Tax=Ruditapes philippinarum TaxID=129788 RepID=UPI00295AC09D|nr:transcription initiation factor TFIID subunit 8-like [Ruditapes philippinarum]
MDSHARSRRKALKVAVGALCKEVGFGMAEESALETLTEMLQSLITETGKSTKAYTELCGRTEVLVTDVITALIDQGINVESIPAHAARQNKSVFIPPGQSLPQPVQRVLSAGEKQNHPAYIPDHLPPFPDPHTYIRTESHKQPVSEYQLIREKAASYKRDTERALTRYVAKTGFTQSLFKDDTSSFPLIAVQQNPHPYLMALLPKDHDLDTLEPTDIPNIKQNDGIPSRSDDSESGQNKTDSSEADSIDNPYLLPIKMPRYKKIKLI